MTEKRNLQLIEFGGIPGSGKSTVFKQVNQFLFERLQYFPGPMAEWINILDDLPVKKGDIHLPFKLKIFLRFFKKEETWLLKNLVKNGLFEESFLDFSEFIEFLLRFNQIPLEDEEWIQDRKIVTQYLMKLIQYYSYINNHTEREYLMFSEGFYRHLKMFVLMGRENYELSIKQILALCPPITLFFYLDVKVPIAFERIMKRPDGPPPQFRNYSRHQLMDMLDGAYESDRDFLNLLESNGKKVVRIENNNSNEELALSEVLLHVEYLFKNS